MQPDGTNRYRLLFSLWNTSTLSYVSWQHMATPLVVRNSFHMLPLEEKNYRRQQQYARARGGNRPLPNGPSSIGEADAGPSSDTMGLPTLPEMQAHSQMQEVEDQSWLPLSQAPGILPGGADMRARPESTSSLDSWAINGGRNARGMPFTTDSLQMQQLQLQQQLGEPVKSPGGRLHQDHDSIAPEMASSVGDGNSDPSQTHSPPRMVSEGNSPGKSPTRMGGGMQFAHLVSGMRQAPTAAPPAVVTIGAVTDVSIRQARVSGLSSSLPSLFFY
ncbi:MAG: hypothetical protein SGPRY_000952 [Prymnesium sp.]